MTREQAAQMIENMPISHECREFFDTALNALKQPEIVRCKDCKHRGEWKRGDFSYVEFPEGSKCPGQCEDYFYSWRPDDDWFCADGERAE